ncbi:hypothetical protein ACA29_07330 [Lederbergia galactosidilytica]|uniref:RamC N-terminal domain-containing protein n=1 Tax=Lederbergia galactosidilytica TaxID=217031 RepID=A0A0Q9YD44_9BACI|nr:hypothetical protein ACA29_07330 [Lederbergia galactosidilytica]
MITIYPHNNKHFHQVISALGKALDKFDGPFILSDKRYPDSKVVHYRYGGISKNTVPTVKGWSKYQLTTPNGETITDERLPYWNMPYWVEDPFIDEEEETDFSLSLNNGRYEINAAIKHAITGGVYIATDYDTGSYCID